MKVLSPIASFSDPASRYRILQYQQYLQQQQIDVTAKEFHPLKDADPPAWAKTIHKMTGINEWRIWNAIKTKKRKPVLALQNEFDIIWQNRLLVSHYASLETNYKKPFVFDFDDAIWLNEGEKAVQTVLQKANIVFAGNNYLAAYANKFNKSVAIIPTTIDTHTIFPLPKNEQPFTIGWMGTHSNFEYLQMIHQPVLQFLEKYADARLMIVSDVPPPQFIYDNSKIIFKQWSANEENEMLNQFDIGLMPMPDNEWTRGKCSYKMLQYLACGKPVVVSPYGNNEMILKKAEVGIGAVTENDWFAAFEKLYTDKAYYETCGANGKKLIDEHYNASTWAAVISDSFKKLV